MEAHYPSSAELAALRRAIARTSRRRNLTGPERGFGAPVRGAWTHEREWGIGASIGPTADPADRDDRREANRMRSAAFARLEAVPA